MKTTYVIQDREAGNFIEEFDTLQDAENKVSEFEKIDRENGTYTENFYEIVEKSQESENDKYKAFLTTNNANDAVVITWAGEIVLAAQIDDEIYAEFFVAEPDFGNWSFGSPYELDIDEGDTVESFGKIYASRVDGEEAIVEEPELFERRQDFWVR
jgi:hypothetical protein